MERKIEEIISKRLQPSIGDLTGMLRQGKSMEDGLVIKHNIITCSGQNQHPSCPLVEVDDDVYFYTFDGRALMFKRDQKAPYIFLPFNVKKVFFFKTKSNKYFITLDSANKLQYNLLEDGYPGAERFVISRNVTQVIRQSNKIFYIGLKNEFQHINIVVEDNGVLRGRMYIPNIKAKLNLSIFYAHSILFMNIDSNFELEDGRRLQLQGDQICEIGPHFLLVRSDGPEHILTLVSTKFTVLDEVRLRGSSRTFALFPLGELVGIRTDDVVRILGATGDKLAVQKEVAMDPSPIAMDMHAGDSVVTISRIVPDEARQGGEVAVDGPSEVKSEPLAERENVLEPGPVSPSPKAACSQSATSFIEEGDRSLDDVHPYNPDKGPLEDYNMLLSRKLDVLTRACLSIENQIREVEKSHRDRATMLAETLTSYFERRVRSIVQETMRKELAAGQDAFRSVENRLKTLHLGFTSIDDSKMMEYVKSLVVDTLLPAIEASMDEIRIQVVNEMRLIKNDEHMKGVKRAVDGLHSIYDKQNEIKNLISKGAVGKAAEMALKGPDADMDIFIENVELPCLEALPASQLLSLLEKTVVMAKEELKPNYQKFLYIAIVRLDLDELDDEELQLFEVLLECIGKLEGGYSEEYRGFVAIIEFQRHKLAKIKNRRGIRSTSSFRVIK
jgi:hypothetical protein